jgi:hypothetical protein
MNGIATQLLKKLERRNLAYEELSTLIDICCSNRAIAFCFREGFAVSHNA